MKFGTKLAGKYYINYMQDSYDIQTRCGSWGDICEFWIVNKEEYVVLKVKFSYTKNDNNFILLKSKLGKQIGKQILGKQITTLLYMYFIYSSREFDWER